MRSYGASRGFFFGWIGRMGSIGHLFRGSLVKAGIMSPEEETCCLELITHAGMGRSESYAALQAAKDGDFDGAEAHLSEAERELGAAHTAQTKLLAGEAQGVGMSPSLLLVHAQDQLMTAICERSLISELIALYRRLETR
jgi:PTS system cellobiose-specific IIA component